MLTYLQAVTVVAASTVFKLVIAAAVSKTASLVHIGQSCLRPNDAITSRLVVMATDAAAAVVAGTVDQRSTACKTQTRKALGGAHVPPTKVFRRLTASVNVKPRVAAAVAVTPF